MHQPLISFGIIVLNGEPFIRYNLRALYPFAHQIIVVEGASPAAVDIATQNGHSVDRTLEILHDFKVQEDPENKLIIVTAEDEGHPNGFWSGEKHEQSQAYAKRATGNYLWQVDMDEFYQPGDMKAVIEMLGKNPEITAVSFPMITFWGGFDYICDGWYLRRGANIYHRLFKWGPGYTYSTHRPPTVLNEKGENLRDIRWMRGKQLAEKGIYLYHYSLVFPKQVADKCAYYQNAEWASRKEALRWQKECFLNLKKPFRVHNVYEYPSWLERYSGSHPEQIEKLIDDVKKGKIKINLRETRDIDKLLHSPIYKIGILILKVTDYFDRCLKILKKFLLYLKRKIKRCFMP
mgnify:CR=1 FL=1